jgi:hypothetical protein
MPIFAIEGRLEIMRLSKTIAATAALLLGASITTQADEASHIPATAQSQAHAEVIANADHALRDSVAGLSNVWIFATGDSNAVFVSYKTETEHLALVQMKGEQIASLRDLNSGAEQVRTASSR